MDLFKEILSEILSRKEITVNFTNLKFSACETVEIESFKALNKIKAIIENNSLSDFECIEEIVCVFEEIGSGFENRHDFS